VHITILASLHSTPRWLHYFSAGTALTFRSDCTILTAVFTISIKISKDGKMINFIYSDDGIGIEKDKISRI
jgi:hypothetical protein